VFAIRPRVAYSVNSVTMIVVAHVQRGSQAVCAPIHPRRPTRFASSARDEAVVRGAQPPTPSYFGRTSTNMRRT
jgi:hypothetical protein